ncbi:NlpC/P60 family protein [Arcobacter sp. s6]|jgi:cell wall-associated NlpC family hydrolase|uniref:NlpC/P60 family protein n=1 Tax=Arcobacter sp. s6 TaxID=3230363 RepID=UPI0034A054FC
MNFKNLLIISMCIYLFTGCSYKNIEDAIDISDNNSNSTFRSASLENTINQKDLKYNKYKTNPTTQAENETFENYDYSSFIEPKHNLNSDLYDFYAKWEGVRYKLGGESMTGIDCSAFIQKAFEEKLALEMPRTTLLQAKVGKEVSKDELEVGDLVFFKTGKTKHVGIYMENGKFMHASTSNGVTISDLDNSYFAKNYWKAKRILN